MTGGIFKLPLFTNQYSINELMFKKQLSFTDFKNGKITESEFNEIKQSLNKQIEVLENGL